MKKNRELTAQIRKKVEDSLGTDDKAKVDTEGTGSNMGGWFGEDIGHVNSKLLIERGYGPYDIGAITAEFCKRAAGRVNPEILKNFVQYSGAMFDRYQEIYDSYEAVFSAMPQSSISTRISSGPTRGLPLL